MSGKTRKDKWFVEDMTPEEFEKLSGEEGVKFQLILCQFLLR